MTLIKSISGIRGTIGGATGENLTPLDLVKFTASYSQWLTNSNKKDKKLTVVVGRDSRISGEMVSSIVTSTLSGMGIDVINIGEATTPTTEMAVVGLNADGGIILTASHNPKEWNALKLLNGEGQFLNAAEGADILKFAVEEKFIFATVDNIGKISQDNYLEKHIDAILDLPLVDVEKIKNANFSVAIDAVDSIGGVAIPALLKRLGVEQITEINCEPTGEFSHIPEPLPENLIETSKIIKDGSIDVGFVVDPDVDRLAIINEDGSMFNEEYTIAAVADYVLSKTPGSTVSNMSSSRVLRDVTEKYGCSYTNSAVGEVNVVEEMNRVNAVLGGEGNGGVIYPELHSGRDALVGVALFLTHLAEKKVSCSELRAQYPPYFISKNKIQLTPEIDVDNVLVKMEEKYSDINPNTIDGVKLEFASSWVHLRKSNTEPIIRIYSEAPSMEEADKLANRIIEEIKEIIG